MTIPFPKAHPIIQRDNDLHSKVRGLEDRIEQRYLVENLRKSVAALREFTVDDSAPPPGFKIPPPMPKEFWESLAPLLNAEEPPEFKVVNEDRRMIKAMSTERGKMYVLGFLSWNLAQSLETLFGGIVVSYIRMFKDKKRLPLEVDNVFKERADLKLTHTMFQRLRNKHFAHKELAHDRHTLLYELDDEGKVSININGPQYGTEYHLAQCEDMEKCLRAVSLFLQQDILHRKTEIETSLTDQQHKSLREHYFSNGISAA